MEGNRKFKRLFCILCNIVYYSIVVFFTVITTVAFFCCVKLLYADFELGNLAEILTALIAFIASIITYHEYKSAKDTKQAQVLSEYNKRYSEDPNIVKVVKYLNYIHEDGTINNPHREKPSNYEVEMFMRFFEELELQIEKGRLSERDVCNLFTYYAFFLSMSKNKELRKLLGVTQKDYEENWDGFKSIANRHNKFKNKKRKE